MKESSLYEVVDEYVLTEYLCDNDEKYVVDENPFDDDTAFNDYGGNVKIVCNLKQIEDIRRYEARLTIENLINSGKLSNVHKLIVNFNNITEYLRYNFDENILIDEIKREIEVFQYDDDFIDELVSVFSMINLEIYEKYKVFCDRDWYEDDFDDDDGWNGFILDFDIEEND